MDYLEPGIILNIHTHDPSLLVQNDQSDVILFNPEKDSTVLRELEKNLREKGIKV